MDRRADLVAIPFLLVTGIIPVFFLSWTQELYDINKWFLFVAAAIITGFLVLTDMIRQKKLIISVSLASITASIMLISSVVSLILRSPNKVEAALSVYGPGLWAGLCLFSFFASPFIHQKTVKLLRFLIVGNATVLALLAIYQYFGIGSFMFSTIEFLKDRLWTPAGTSMTLISIFTISLPLLIEDLIIGLKRKEDTYVVIWTTFFILVMAGLILTLIRFLPTVGGLILPFSAGWAIALDAFKNPSQVITGTGVENFLYAFTKGRPLWLNQTALWSIEFTTNATAFFHLLTTLGIGAISLLIPVRGIRKLSWGLGLSLLLAYVVFFFAPPSFASIFLLWVLILISVAHQQKILTLRIPSGLRLPSWGVAAVIGIIFLLGLTALTRAYWAEHIFFLSLKAIETNNGSLTYSHQVHAKTLNPFVARFRTSLSQTNLILANRIAEEASKSASLSGSMVEKDRKTIATLLQQSISEAKVATSLAPQNALVWRSLGAQYQRVSTLAEGAKDWATAAYQKSIELDPTNPVFRLELAGIYVSQKKYPEALQLFTSVTKLKPDLAIAYYNIANVHQLQGDWLSAGVALRTTQKLLRPNDPNYPQVQHELDLVTTHLSPDEKAKLESMNP